MIPEGKYNAHAIQWDFGFAGEKNTRQVCVQFEILEGEFAGHCINWYGYFTDKSKDRTMQSLRYCGWSNDDIMSMEGMGRYIVQLDIGHEEKTEGKNQGKIFPKVKFVNRLGGGGPIKLEKPMDMAQKRMFAAEMKMLAKSVPPMVGGYPAPDRAKTEVPGGAASEEDPF